ncbi:MAG: hypothetical protein LBE02_05215 [Spirochaetaceae bacterium]|jgi:hypothetical protein|nr:hypothetical protein [Spirochaetaceae bacterium]
MKQPMFFLMITACISNAFTQASETKIVQLPYEIILNENEKLIIRENGIIEFCKKFFVYKKRGMEYPIYESLLTVNRKNNLCGINIMEEMNDGAYASYTLIINIKTKQDVPYEKDGFFRFRDFFSIKNYFILVFAEKAYAFDDSNGELLWMQTYKQKDGRRIIINEDHFIIDDMDGNRYKIYGNGRKIKL